MFKITQTPHHFLVNFESKVTVASILAAIAEVMRHPDYVRLNVLWNFGDAEVFLKQTDLDIIVQEIENRYPPNVEKKKAALIAANGFNQFLAESFEIAASRLPFPIKVFRTLADAEMWMEIPETSDSA